MTRPSVHPVPVGYTTVTAYLIVADADRMLTFLEKAFDAKPGHMLRGKDGEIRHAEIKVGSSMLMLGQALEGWAPRPSMFYLYVEDCDAVYAKALAAGAKSLSAPEDQFYGDRSGGVEDFAGNYWYIGTHIEDLSEEEIQRRMVQHQTKPDPS